MRRVLISSLALAALLCGCNHTQTCAPVGIVTRVVVHVFPTTSTAESIRTITDPTQIHRLVAFANARRQVFVPSTYTMPAPKITATFYDNKEFVSSFGAGPDFFFVSDANHKGIRDASPSEIKEFSDLIKLP